MAPKLTLKDLYGERGARRFTQQAHPKQVRAAARNPNGTTQSGVPFTAPGPAAHTWHRVPGQAIPGGDARAVSGFGFAGNDGVDRGALDQKLVELDTAFKFALHKYVGGTLFPGDQMIQDLFGNSSIANALKMTYRSLQLLGGDLYQAVIGSRPFPLDNGTSVNTAAALQAWNQLAMNTQETLVGVLGYMGKWGPLPGLLEGAKKLANPFNWPWWAQLAAAAGAVWVGARVLGTAGQARTAFRGFKTLPGYHRKRKKR